MTALEPTGVQSSRAPARPGGRRRSAAHERLSDLQRASAEVEAALAALPTWRAKPPEYLPFAHAWTATAYDSSQMGSRGGAVDAMGSTAAESLSRLAARLRGLREPARARRTTR